METPKSFKEFANPRGAWWKETGKTMYCDIPTEYLEVIPVDERFKNRSIDVFDHIAMAYRMFRTEKFDIPAVFRIVIHPGGMVIRVPGQKDVDLMMVLNEFDKRIAELKKAQALFIAGGLK
jgi:hypothetical protein